LRKNSQFGSGNFTRMLDWGINWNKRNWKNTPNSFRQIFRNFNYNVPKTQKRLTGSFRNTDAYLYGKERNDPNELTLDNLSVNHMMMCQEQTINECLKTAGNSNVNKVKYEPEGTKLSTVNNETVYN